jgi:multiple sugar transport system permease protein
MSETVASPKSEVTSPPTAVKNRSGIFAGQHGMKRREALLAYLFLLPAILIIGIFGLFPLIFSAYQSTRAGLNNIVGRPDGFGQYVRAIDNLAYVLAFWVSFFFLIFAVRKVYALRTQAKEHNDSYWPWIIPGAFVASGLTLLLLFIFNFLPGVLEIGELLKGTAPEEREQLFFQYLGEAWRAERVASVFWTAVLAIVVGLVLNQLFRKVSVWRSYRAGDYFSGFVTAVLLFILSIVLGYITYDQIQLAYATAAEEGEALEIWAQVITISAGFILWLFAWLLWRSGNSHNSSTFGWIFRSMAATLLLAGGWILIAELPAAIASGNEDWWQGLKVTLFYVMGALPLELFLGLSIAVLLYQDIKAKGLYRMIFFLPFITPAVGSAAVFRVLFSGNPSGAINRIMVELGMQPLGWLNESTGINQLIAESLGITIPGWMAGPSLALVVAIIYGIWRYTGYNVVFFLAGLGNIDREMYEAASIDGANRWAQFRNITVPLLSPITYFLTIFGIIGTFKAFNTIYVLRSNASLGSMDTASLVIFDAFNRDTRYGYAAALGIVLLIIILAATSAFDRIAKGRIFYG